MANNKTNPTNNSFINTVIDFLSSLSSKSWFKILMASVFAILIGLILGIIILIVVDPSNSVEAILRLLKGPFNDAKGGWIGFGKILVKAVPIIFIAFGIGFAFKTGVFNIGASGQFTVGLFAALVVGLMGEKLGGLQWIIAMLAGGVAGALWGMVPGIFKAYFNVNVVITGIMLNYIGMYFVNGLIGNQMAKWLLDSSRNQTFAVVEQARTPQWFFRDMFQNIGVDIGIILAILTAVLLYFVLNRTVFGRELMSVGKNKHAAKYAGVNEKKAIIISMTISGFLAGIGGALFILSVGAHDYGVRITPVSDAVRTEGFNAIPVALLANSNPIGVIFSSLFIQYIQSSGLALQSISTSYSKEVVDIIIAVILYFSAFSLIVSQFLQKARKKRKERKVNLIHSNESLEEVKP
jgi:simple sugar transport system permease protein